MDTTGLNPDLATVLSGYYRNNFTSQEHWELIESVRFDGVIELPEGSVRFTAFKKKPDYCKIVVFAPNGGRIVMGYDGTDAWQLNTLQSDAQAEDMPPQEALNFIRDATTGGHLLYPLVTGKKVELVGTSNFDGKRHYELLVTLPDGQTVRSLLDMTTFKEVRQTTINNVNGNQEITTNSDFREIDGMLVPGLSILTIDGQQIHQSRIERVQTNLGVMPWMFSRSSGANVPGAPMPAQAANLQLGTAPREQSSDPVLKYSLGQPDADPWSIKAAFEIDPAALSEQETAEILQEIDSE
jgi:hypothetical protein